MTTGALPAALLILLPLALEGAFAVEARAEEFARLRGPEIRALLIGRDLTDDNHSLEYFRPDGVLIATDPGSGERRQGRWRVQGELLCIAPQAPATAQCFQVWRAGSAVSLRRRDQDRPPLAFVREHVGR